MSSRRVRVRLWSVDGLPTVRLRAAERTMGASSRVVDLHVSISERHTAIQSDVLGALNAVPEMRRQQRLRIMGSEALARPWRTPGLLFGDLVILNATFWVHSLEALPEGISGVLGLDVLERAGAIVNLRESWLTVSAEEPTSA